MNFYFSVQDQVPLLTEQQACSGQLSPWVKAVRLPETLVFLRDARNPDVHVLASDVYIHTPF